MASTAARARSVQIRIGRRRKRSAQAPANSPNSSTETPAAPLRIPIWTGPASSVIAAANGSAVRVIRDPICEIAWPVQSFTNSR